MFLVQYVAFRDQIYLKPKSDSTVWTTYATRVFRVQPRMILIMPAISRVHKFQFLVFVNSKKRGSAAVSERWNMYGPGISPSGTSITVLQF
jgi:hypothetical protein